MKQPKLNAFTILEVTVTMLVSGILIGMTYTIYVIVSRSFTSFRQKNDKISVVVNLDHVLARDFDLADTILKDTDGILVKKPAGNIKYAFYPDFITRESVKTDTFKVQCTAVTTSFEDIPLNDLQTDNEKNRIDGLDFVLLFDGKQIPCAYRKIYSSADLINRMPDATN